MYNNAVKSGTIGAPQNNQELRAVGYFEDLAARLEFLSSILVEEIKLHNQIDVFLNGEWQPVYALSNITGCRRVNGVVFSINENMQIRTKE